MDEVVEAFDVLVFEAADAEVEVDGPGAEGSGVSLLFSNNQGRVVSEELRWERKPLVGPARVAE